MIMGKIGRGASPNGPQRATVARPCEISDYRRSDRSPRRNRRRRAVSRRAIEPALGKHLLGSGRAVVIDRREQDSGTHWNGAVPRAMLCAEDTLLVLFREFVAGVEEQVEIGSVRNPLDNGEYHVLGRITVFVLL